MVSRLPVEADDWESHWERYGAAAVNNPAQRMRHDFITQWLTKSAHVSDARIFDLGSGQGDLLQSVSECCPTASLLGAEISRRGVTVSQAKVPRAKFIAADILNPSPALEAYADWATHAVCSEVLEHVDDPTSFLAAARKYLRPDAELIVTIPKGPMSAFDRHIGHRQHFDQARIAEILKRAGYSTERVYTIGFPFFNLYRLLVIAGGRRLTRDVESGSRGLAAGWAGRFMQLFSYLFRANLRDSRFGWQIVVVARKTSP